MVLLFMQFGGLNDQAPRPHLHIHPHTNLKTRFFQPAPHQGQARLDLGRKRPDHLQISLRLGSHVRPLEKRQPEV